MYDRSGKHGNIREIQTKSGILLKQMLISITIAVICIERNTFSSWAQSVLENSLVSIFISLWAQTHVKTLFIQKIKKREKTSCCLRNKNVT